MPTSRNQLAELVKAHREQKELSQEQLAAHCGVATNRSAIAHLEQGLRIPKPDVLTTICRFLQIPPLFWEPFTNEDSRERLEFEEMLVELVGRPLTLNHLDGESLTSAEKQVQRLLSVSVSQEQTYDLFNSVLVYYGVSAVSWSFFKRYLGPEAFSSLSSFEQKITLYQHDAVQLFSTLREAYRVLNSVPNVELILAPLEPRSIDSYSERIEWDVSEEISDERLPDLGYISAARVRKEAAERQVLKTFLETLAKTAREQGRPDLTSTNEKTKRRMDSLLRKFNSSLHGLFSPLFAPDADLLEREAARLAPKSDVELARMSETQHIAQRNLAQCLSADHMDVYVATSMRTDADFVSVNQFVRSLFEEDIVRPLKLRYFNPTQSWIDDRIGKGLVEALMLRRAAVTIYMAQKSDTFGKDSEASVALGQGRPVIVYVPKLVVENLDLDTEDLFRRTRAELVAMLKSEDESLAEDIDESIDDEALVSRVLTSRLQAASEEQLVVAAKSQWADFDLYGEAERIPSTGRAAYRTWLDKTVQGKNGDALTEPLRSQLISVLVATAVRFERRAQLFREIHPLALQIILSSGVLNGILVVRSVRQCAEVLNALIQNKLNLKLVKDERNYRLVEVGTQSTIRVISRHTLLRNAFEAQYERERRERGQLTV
ncbi:MAG TPA: helix-turn-helix transcriptional regulator [Pyrinomonadaceae bacterium]|nr:helix-turn-helix transcriptional regulator [Pyrinomonadaceae bacterium]